jgi:hypothetical protein
MKVLGVLGSFSLIKVNRYKQFFNKKIKFLFVIFLFLSSSSVYSEVKNNYYLWFLYQDLIFNLRVNDVSLRKELSPRGYSVSLPVGLMLKKGWNTIEFDYKPFDTKKIKNGFSENFKFNVRMDYIDKSSKKEKRVHLFGAMYDNVKKEVRADVLSDKYDPFIIVADEPFSFSNSSIVTAKYKPISTTRIKFKFYVNDDIPDPVWMQGRAIDLDTIDKGEIIDKEKYLYSLISNDNFNSIYSEFFPVWNRMAHLLDYPGGVKEFVENNDFERTLSSVDEGHSLLDYNFYENVYKFELMGEGKLVRILPTRLAWVTGDTIYSSTSVIYYIDESGQVKVGGVVTDSGKGN